jgi:D-3-phosphoglycerate dehydrogenase
MHDTSGSKNRTPCDARRSSGFRLPRGKTAAADESVTQSAEPLAEPRAHALLTRCGECSTHSRVTHPATSFPKERIKVLLLENVHPSALDIFRADGVHVETVPGALKGDELAERIADVHVLGIRSKTRVTADVLSHAHRLLTLGCFCIGTNQVDLAAANRAGVPVFNAPFSNTRSVAEMILAEIVVLARQLGDRSREVHAGKWRKVATSCYEVRGKTLGIVGYGHIGRQIGVIAEALGMSVIFYDIASKLPMGNNHAVETLGALLAQADFVTLHVPETPQTKNLFGKEELAMMRPGSFLLNASRGSVVDIPALATALREKHLAGAAIDVYPDEPETNTDDFVTELRDLPNVILTPHIGGSTSEAQAAIGREVATSLVKFVNGGATTGAVNFPAIEVPQAPGTHRILNVHRNVPGVLRDVNSIVSNLNANIRAQVLATDANIGYLVMDLDHDVSDQVKDEIAGLQTNIRTRILY